MSCPPRSHAAFGQKPTSRWDDRLVQLWEDVEETLRHLRRMGFVAYQVLCGPLFRPLCRPLCRPLSQLRRMAFVVRYRLLPTPLSIQTAPL